jgi:hypothetical protein
MDAASMTPSTSPGTRISHSRGKQLSTGNEVLGAILADQVLVAVAGNGDDVQAGPFGGFDGVSAGHLAAMVLNRFRRANHPISRWC